MRQRRDHLVGQQLAQNISRGLQRARPERDDSDRRAQVFGQVAALDDRLFARRAEPKRANRLLDMLDIALTEVLDVGIERGRQLVAHVGRDDDLVGTGQRHQTRRKVDPVAIHIVLVGNQRADIDADPQMQATRLLGIPIRLSDRVLHRECDGDRGGDPRELQHQSVAETLDQSPVLAGQQPVHDMVDERPPALHRTGLIFLHQTHGLDDVGDQHGTHDARDIDLWREDFGAHVLLPRLESSQ